MKNIKIKLSRINGALVVQIPETIAELMDFAEGDIIEVPFHNFIKVSKNARPVISGSKITNVESVVTVKVPGYEKDLTREEVIEKLDHPTEKMRKYRNVFIIWNGERFGVKNLCKELFVEMRYDLNTIQGERYLNRLGFETYHEKPSR